MTISKSQIKPEIRFPEFHEKWNSHRLSEFLKKYSENNKDGEFDIDEILSLSSNHGIVNRKELLEDTYADVNHFSYKKTRLNDFIYGKSISSNYPFGLFKVNDYKDGLLSTLYFTFKVKENVDPKFLDFYFSYPNRANGFLIKYVLVGDRYITADADYLLSGKINVPTLVEQQKIVNFYKLVNEWINNCKVEKVRLEDYKKGLMQKIFSQEIRFKDKNNEDFPEWETVKLGKIFSERSERAGNKEYDLLSVTLGRGVIKYDHSAKIDSSSENKANYKVVRVGDIAYNTMRMWQGASGVSEYEGIVSPAYTVVTPRKGDSGFFAFLFKMPRTIFNFYRYSQGLTSDTWNIKFNHFSEVEVTVPSSIEEQIRIRELLVSMDEIIASKAKKIKEAEAWKNGLLQKMFV